MKTHQSSPGRSATFITKLLPQDWQDWIIISKIAILIIVGIACYGFACPTSGISYSASLALVCVACVLGIPLAIFFP